MAKDLMIRCFSCGKNFEDDEVWDIDPGNGKLIKLCFLCKRAHEKAIKEKGNWLKQKNLQKRS